MSDRAFAFLTNTALQNVSPGASIAFNGAVKKDVKFYVGQTGVILRKSGNYQYSFQTDGTAGDPTQPTVLGLSINGVLVNNTLSVKNGAGIFRGRRGDLVNLTLLQDSPGGGLLLQSGSLAGASSASLTITYFDR